MKISTKARYGLRILLDIAISSKDSPRLVREIAKNQNISEKYVSKLIIELRKADIVESSRGSKGGYKLKMNIAEITLLKIVETMEGHISVLDCLTCKEPCKYAKDCPTCEVWHNFNEKIRIALNEVSLKDILEGYEIKDL